MRVFLSYASTDRPLAERVCRVLETERHDVFFDRDDLGGGDAFGERIRDGIRRAHVLVYLISQASVTPPSYALTELTVATGLTARRRPVILPVLVDRTPIREVPAALRAYTILEPQGDIPADIAAALDRIGRRRRKQRQFVAAAIVALSAGLGGFGYLMSRSSTTPAPPAVGTGTEAGAPASEAPTSATPTSTTPPAAASATPTAAQTPPAAVDIAGMAIPGYPGGLPVTPDAIQALNESILKQTPPERRVTLMGMPGGDGWMATLIIADQSVTKVSYRLDGDSSFTDTGSSDLPSVLTGQPQPNTSFQMPGEFWRRRQVAVKYTDVKGREHGPFQLDFEPRVQFAKFAKQSLGFVSWVSFQRESSTRLLAYFTPVVAFKAAFKEIKYSIDSEALDKTFPLKVDHSEGWPGRMDDDTLYIELPKATKFVAVRLSFTDGTVQTRKFEVRVP